MITKKQLLTGVIKFIRAEVIPHVADRDRSLKIVMSAALYAVDAKPDVVEPFFPNPIVSAILQGENGEYDTSTIFAVLDSVIQEYGGIPVTIPPIKFVTTTETTFTFHAGDVDTLKNYLVKEMNNA